MTNAEETQRMWELMIRRFEQNFSRVDYTRSINFPSGMLESIVHEALAETLQEIEDETLKAEREKCLSELENWNLNRKRMD